MSDDEGLEICARGLRQIAPHAERKGVTLCLELLNSKVDHADYMADRTAWGVALVKRVGSPRVKLLYDIYHMQIMEGDVIRTIRESIGSIAHFHTAGVPGRHEIDGRQELHYRPSAGRSWTPATRASSPRSSCRRTSPGTPSRRHSGSATCDPGPTDRSPRAHPAVSAPLPSPPVVPLSPGRKMVLIAEDLRRLEALAAKGRAEYRRASGRGGSNCSQGVSFSARTK
jgi:hypothetical protein